MTSFTFPGKSQKVTHALTLVEMLVSMAILSILMTILFTTIFFATTSWRKDNAHQRMIRDARTALYYLRKDLQGIFITPEFPALLNIHSNERHAISPPPEIASPSLSHNIFFLSKQPSPQTISQTPESSLNTLGYFCSYQAYETGTRSYLLYRHFKTSSESWQSSSSPHIGINSYLYDPLNSKLYTPSLNNSEIIAPHIINLKIHPHYSAPPQQATTSGNFSTRLNLPPDFIDVSFTIISEDSIPKLTEDDWVSLPSFTKSKQFWTRIHIP